MFSKVLIANRGAIAVRIERTLAKMGVKSVAVYSKADRDSLHVENADEAVYLGEGTAKDTYLDVDKIIKAALDTGAEAIPVSYTHLDVYKRQLISTVAFVETYSPFSTSSAYDKVPDAST